MLPVQNIPRRRALGKLQCQGRDADGDRCTKEILKIACSAHAHQLREWPEKIQLSVYKLHNTKCTEKAWNQVYELVSRGIKAKCEAATADGLDGLELAVAELEAAVPVPMLQAEGV